MEKKQRRVGFVTLLGRPSAGKSSFVNAVIDDKISAVSSVPQTTRRLIRGIYTDDQYQIIFQDVPGLHGSSQKWNQSINWVTKHALADTDIILRVIDGSRVKGPEEEAIDRIVAETDKPVITIVTKCDLFQKKDQQDSFYTPKNNKEGRKGRNEENEEGGEMPGMAYRAMKEGKNFNKKNSNNAPLSRGVGQQNKKGGFGSGVGIGKDPTIVVPNHENYRFIELLGYPDGAIFVSNITREGIVDVVKKLGELLPEGPLLYPESDVTDQDVYTRVSEIIREKVFQTTYEEVPHHTFVEVEHMEDTGDMVKICAYIYCMTDSQKKILIGSHGSKIKEIGIASRGDLQDLFEKKIFLDLHIKVSSNWQDRENITRKILGKD